MYIDVWSDVVCPWCYIGKRRLETALGEFEHAADVELRWHSFQLDASHPKGHREPVRDMLAKKTGAPPEQVEAMTGQVTELAAAEGLTYDLRNAVAVNTLDAHRLNHLADRHGLGGPMHERLLKAHLCDAEVLDDLETLVRLGAEVGVPEDEAREVLEGTKYADEVDADFAEARRIGVNGVPFFVLNGTHGVSGAQSPVTFLSALEKAHQSR
ncbi:DsbA family oxidoreductase [Amycolatopsis pittospori]|uniref:DsbA family oxidoreductase n=1 Tax=Amycolatopsis pittospori TaxID=2749434 RepID=UPI0015F1031A|nr:DsbA family oxidoreductase [Amycolatopsis pittospori]